MQRQVQDEVVITGGGLPGPITLLVPRSFDPLTVTVIRRSSPQPSIEQSFQFLSPDSDGSSSEMRSSTADSFCPSAGPITGSASLPLRSPPADTGRGWLFADEGASYRIRMSQGEFTVPKRAGEKYLHWFACHPRQEIQALGLVVQLRGKGIVKVLGDGEGPETDEDRPADGGCEPVDGRTTSESLKRLRQALVDMRHDRALAEEDGDIEKVHQLDREAAAIEARIGKDTNIFGKIREASTNDRKAEESIDRALRRAYSAVLKGKNAREAREAFVKHFKAYLRLGYMCQYKPATGEGWLPTRKKT